MLFHNSSVCAWMQPFVEAARSKQLEQRQGMILSWPLDVQYSKEAEVMLITAYLWFYSGNSWSSCQKRPQILPWQYQCMLGSQLTVAQLQAPCIWFLPHTLPSTSLFLLIISSSDPKRNPGWKKIKRNFTTIFNVCSVPTKSRSFCSWIWHKRRRKKGWT